MPFLNTIGSKKDCLLVHKKVWLSPRGTQLQPWIPYLISSYQTGVNGRSIVENFTNAADIVQICLEQKAHPLS
jgi:hypothetical protein